MKPKKKPKKKPQTFTEEEIEVSFVVNMAMVLGMHGDVAVPFVRKTIEQMKRIQAAYSRRKK